MPPSIPSNDRRTPPPPPTLQTRETSATAPVSSTIRAPALGTAVERRSAAEKFETAASSASAKTVPTKTVPAKDSTAARKPAPATKAEPAPKDGPKKGIDVRLGEPSVVVDDVYQIYRTDTTDRDAYQQAGLGQKLAKLLIHRPIKTAVRAVDGVSFVARTGESIGILGLNGSGKSTLLRMIAGVEPPVAGRVLARSQPTLLGVGAALVPDMTGLRNIELGCLAMGLTPEETTQVTPAIADLAGIGKSLYRPMKTYSSGMGARLRFAINAASRPDILLIDEALGTGDATFKKRSESVLTEIREEAGTVFLVSHAAQTIEEMCTRAIWLNQGRLIADGPAWELARAYRYWAFTLAKGEQDKADEAMTKAVHDFPPKPFTLVEADGGGGTPPLHWTRR